MRLGTTPLQLRVGSTVAASLAKGSTVLAADGPLDISPNAAAAYSLRKLRRDWTGAVVRGRRGVDAAQRDFSPEELTDGTVAAWCAEVGATGVVVAKWYDQSGNDNHAEQTTSQYMPLLYSAATGLVLEGGKPAMLFDGVDDRLSVPSSTATFKFLHDGTRSAVFAALSYGLAADPNAVHVLLATSDIASAQVGTQIFFDDRAGVNVNAHRVAVQRGVSGVPAAQFTTQASIVPQDQFVLYQLLDVANATADERLEGRVNSGLRLAGNTNSDPPSTANSTKDFCIGGQLNGVFPMAGTISELIIYPSDQTANREYLEASMGWYYG